MAKKPTKTSRATTGRDTSKAPAVMPQRAAPAAKKSVKAKSAKGAKLTRIERHRQVAHGAGLIDDLPPVAGEKIKVL